MIIIPLVTINLYSMSRLSNRRLSSEAKNALTSASDDANYIKNRRGVSDMPRRFCPSILDLDISSDVSATEPPHPQINANEMQSRTEVNTFKFIQIR